jgi:Ribonuclease G/E
MGALQSALERAVERAETLESALERAVDPPRRLTAPAATTWLWFGREARFALDEDRRAVTATMPGHHRVKAASSEASRAVDFVEALGSHDGDFAFEAVTDTFGPAEGDHVRLDHGKPDGRRIVLGRAEVTDRDPEGTLTLRREMTAGGTYDALGVDRAAGDVAITKVREGRWWYPTVYRGDDGERKGTYVNVCTPVECFPDAVRYVDLHVDVVKGPDGEVRRVDDDELDEAVAAGQVSEALAEKARSVATSLESAL